MKIVRDNILCKDITFIDGLPGTGKSLVAPFISSLSNAELWKLNHIYEYILILSDQNKITIDAATALLRIYADLDLYNSSISRDINYRSSDDSSAHKNLLHDIYLKRANTPDGEDVVNEILDKKPSLIIMTHSILDKLPLLENIFNDRKLSFISIVRNPATVIKTWQEDNWFNRYNQDPREFTIIEEENGVKLPWFARKDAPSTYQEIDHIAYFVKEYFMVKERIPNKFIQIRFEDFEVNPNKYISIFKDLYGDETSVTRDLLDKFSLPREDNLSFRNDIGRKDLDFILPLISDSSLKDEINELHKNYINSI